MGHSQWSSRNTDGRKDVQMVWGMDTWLFKKQLQQSGMFSLKGRRLRDDIKAVFSCGRSVMKRREWLCSLLFQEIGVQGREFWDHYPDKLSDNRSCLSTELQNNTFWKCLSLRQGTICHRYCGRESYIGRGVQSDISECPLQLKDLTILFSPVGVSEFHRLCAFDQVIDWADMKPMLILYAYHILCRTI